MLALYHKYISETVFEKFSNTYYEIVVFASAVSVVCGKKGQDLMGSSINSNTYSAGSIYNTARRLSRLGLGKVYRRCRENSEKSLINSE